MRSNDQQINRAIISEHDIGSTFFRIYENRIFHVTVRQGEMVTMKIVREGHDFLNRNGGGEYYNLYEFQAFSEVEPEVREWAASPSNNNYTILDAIVISSLPQKILADYYIRYNKSSKPTRIFNSIDKAIVWIDEVMSGYEKIAV